MVSYSKGRTCTPAKHIADKGIGEYLMTLDMEKPYHIKVTEGTKAKSLAQNDCINGLIRQMYRVGGHSKPEELVPFLNTYADFREWIKANVICIFEVYNVVAPKAKKPEPRRRCKSVGDYTLKDGRMAIETIKAYLQESGMNCDTEISKILTQMEFNRGEI